MKLICEYELHTSPNKKASAAMDHGKSYMRDRPPLSLILGIDALRSCLKLICEYELHTSPNKKLVPQRIMVKTISRSDRSWFPILCVMILLILLILKQFPTMSVFKYHDNIYFEGGRFICSPHLVIFGPSKARANLMPTYGQQMNFMLEK